jgi:tetratricopeptide (TPR) repeat protein
MRIASYRVNVWMVTAMSSLMLTGLLLAGCGGGSGEANIEEGLTKLIKGDYKAAAKKLQIALEKLPDNPTAWCNLGIAQWKLGQTDQAQVSLRKAADLDSNDPTPLEFLGGVLLQMQDLDEARKMLVKAGELSPNSPQIYTALGAVEFHAGQNGMAEAYFKQALAIEPNYPPALYNMGRLYRERMHNTEAAIQYFGKYIEVGGNDEHVKLARAELERQPSAVVSTPRQSTTEQTKERPTEQQRPAVEQPGPKPADPLVASARRAIEKDNFDEALELLKQATRKTPPDPDALWELAMLYDKALHYPDKAAQTYQKFSQLFPNDPRAAKPPRRPLPPALPNDLNAGSKPVQQKADIRIPAPPKPDPRMARDAFNLGLKLQNAKNWDGAINAYKRAIEFGNASADVFYNLGLACKSRGDLQAAADAFIRALKSNPGMTSASYMLAVVYREQKEREKAIEQLSSLLRAQPNFAEAHCLMGFLYLDNKRPDLARKRFERYLQLAPNGESAKQVREWLSGNRS